MRQQLGIVLAVGALLGALWAVQRGVVVADAATTQIRTDCVGFDTNAAGKPSAVLTIYSQGQDAHLKGTLVWYAEDGDVVGSPQNFSVDNPRTLRISSDLDGIVRAKLRMDTPAIVDARLEWSDHATGVTCSTSS